MTESLENYQRRESLKVERKFIFTSSWQCFPFNWIEAICDVVSVVSQIYTPTFVDGRREHNVLSVERRHERFIGVAGRLSTSQHIRERDIDTNSQQHCRANEAAESREVWEVRKVLKNVNYKKLMCPSDSTNLSAYQMFCRRHRSFTHRENPEKRKRDEDRKDDGISSDDEK